MSNRPQQHQLETKSRLAFESSLPIQWVYRPVIPDYGVDGLVEIFTEEGRATGDFFFVQLKATSSVDANSALTIRFSHEKCDYYLTLAIPLLVVSYHEVSNDLYAKWFEVPSAKERYKNEKTMSFKLSEGEVWNIERCDSIASELENIREADRLEKRDERIEHYYDARSKINWAQSPVPEDTEPLLELEVGNVVFHDAFGRGIVDKFTTYYYFVKFDDDQMLRKFEPGDSRRGFVKLAERA